MVYFDIIWLKITIADYESHWALLYSAQSRTMVASIYPQARTPFEHSSILFENNNKSTKITIQCGIVMTLLVGMLKLHGFFVANEREGKNIRLRL